MVPWMGVFVIVIASIFRRDAIRRYKDVIVSIGYATYVGVGIQAHIYLARHMLVTIDPALLRIDHQLHFDPLAFNRFAVRHNLLMIVLILAYVMLPIMMGLAWILEQNEILGRAVLWGGITCFVCYTLFPAVGPAYYDFTTGVAKYAPRNCMPSMHFTWALLLAINARSVRLRLVYIGYACLLAVATLALGEHYLIDLIAALFYAPAMQMLAVRTFQQWRFPSGW